MSERMEVEVVVDCHVCRGVAAKYCSCCQESGVETVKAYPAPNSRTEALLRLAEAAVRCHKAGEASTTCYSIFGSPEECAAFYAKVGYTEAEALAVEKESYDSHAAYTEALAAVLAFDQGEGKDG